ncbi:MAG TPA: hypothetical protein VIX84_07495 [Acidimicrobiales bacterium]
MAEPRVSEGWSRRRQLPASPCEKVARLQLFVERGFGPVDFPATRKTLAEAPLEVPDRGVRSAEETEARRTCNVPRPVDGRSPRA